MENEIECFLRELSELTEKHGIVICGCGCCGSPYLEERKMVQEMTVAENLKFDEKKKKYSCKVLLKGADHERKAD
jgi:hypothetical protein